MHASDCQALINQALIGFQSTLHQTVNQQIDNVLDEKICTKLENMDSDLAMKIQKLIDCNCSDDCDGVTNNLIVTDPCAPTVLKFNHTCKVHITMVGGGGAGGIGTTIDHCFIYGSGGAAGEGLTKILDVQECEKWTIVVGKGGSAIDSINGGKTYIKSTLPGKNEGDDDIENWIMMVGGGKNGSPQMEQVLAIMDNSNDITCADLDMGEIIKGGIMVVLNCGPPDTCGDGEDGGVGLPSQTAATGKGGCTKYTSPGGAGGTIKNIAGKNGANGSGGGGSLPHVMDSSPLQASGNGGDGYVMLSFINCKVECVEDMVTPLNQGCH